MAEAGIVEVYTSRSFSPKGSRPHYRSPVRSKEEVPEGWLCLFCRGLLIIAFQTSCGCRYCELCLDILAKEEKPTRRRCPGGAPVCGPFARNKGDISERPKPDNAVRKLIQKVLIYCPNDCDEKNLIAANLITHLNESCPKQFCPQCKEVSRRVYFDQEHGNTTCRNCLADVAKCLFESDHRNPMSKNFCPKFQGKCPFCRTAEIKADEVQLHRLFCEKWPQKCKYEALECNGDHGEDAELELVSHVSCLLRSVVGNWQRPSAAERHRMRETSLENVNASGGTVLDLEQMYKTVRQDSDFTQRLEKAVEQCDSQRDRTERTFVMFNRLTALALQSRQPTAFPVAPYIWRIPNYLELKKHESVIDSRPFLSGDYGHKMRVRLYLNGDGQGRGTHLSAYIILMAYDYDNLLTWPFHFPFLFTLLDQTQKGQDYQQLIHPNPKSRSFQRPPRTEADSSSVRASGCAKFFPLERLLPHCIYLQDGTLYIKIDILSRSAT